MYEEKNNPYTLEYLMTKYSKYIYNLAYKLCFNQQDAEDLFQETWLKVYKSLHTYNKNKKIENWLYTICINAYRDKYRKNKIIRHVKQFFSSEEYNKEIANIKDKRIVEDNVLQKEEYQELNKALNNLKDTYRIPLILFYYKELSYEEIAEILDIPIGTVKSRMNYSKKLLKERMSMNG